jgi:hypothetical protein
LLNDAGEMGEFSGISSLYVIPAKAGIHEHGGARTRPSVFIDPGLRRDDG